MRVIGYARVSTEEQAAGGFSLEAQEAKIRGYCGVYDLELLEIISDPGASAKTLDRPGMARVLAELRARKGRAEGLVLAKLDRLTRSIGDWAELIREFFRDERKRLFSVGESIDTRSATGRMVLNMIMTIAEWEREIIGERTSDALQAKIRRGERCGKVRFGQDLAPDGRTLVPNAREQEAIAMMRARKSEGMTYRDLAGLLEELGIGTKEGGLWRPATIRRILTRPVA
jgi:site-specific DNA recombinase